MGMKRPSNIKKYYHKKGSICLCEIISKVMTWICLMTLIKCLHITNLLKYVQDKSLRKYDKLEQTQ